MQTLGVVGMEEGELVAVSDTGERFRIRVDGALRAALRGEPAAPTERRLPPREIQAHVRAGLTAQQVAALTGAPLAYIERFTGPVLAERRYVVEAAQAVRLPADAEGAVRTFGALLGDRLAALDAAGVTWSSAKEAGGWVVGVAFTADGIAHDARWRFDVKRQQLAAENVEAATLSQDGTPAALTPRLRAIEPTTPVAIVSRSAEPAVRAAPAPAPDRSRFDSAAFSLPDLAPAPAPAPAPVRPSAVRPAAAGPVRAAPASASAPTSAPAAVEPPPTQAMPAVRAAHRAAAEAPAAPAAAAPAPRGRIPDRAPDRSPAEEPAPPARPAASRGPAPARRGRPRPERRVRDDGGTPTKPVALPARGRGGRSSMPSWDEIVFGRDED